MAKKSTKKPKVDPVVTEIVRNGIIAVTEEMKTNLMRTAYNMIIYEALDFTVGLFDVEGNTVSIGLGLPMFIRGMSDTVKAKLDHYGIENLDPGDILLTNDAYTTGSHLNHMTFTVPIFHDGEVVAFSCCMAHWPDVGGTLDGATTDIFSEGLQMPIVKIYRKGAPNEELISIIKTNVRLPERAMGDFRAQIAANALGARRLEEIVQRYGVDGFAEFVEELFAYTERRTRRALNISTDASYRFERGSDREACRIASDRAAALIIEVAGGSAGNVIDVYRAPRPPRPARRPSKRRRNRRYRNPSSPGKKCWRRTMSASSPIHRRPIFSTASPKPSIFCTQKDSTASSRAISAMRRRPAGPCAAGTSKSCAAIRNAIRPS